MLTFHAHEFVKPLEGQTTPVLFQVGDAYWVFRYGRGGKELRLASELIAYRLAAHLGVSVPELRLARNADTFSLPNPALTVPAGVGTATSWMNDALYPDVERRPLASFWQEEKYLAIVAAARLADTWVMNYDRRKIGNIALTGGDATPSRVYFLDFDQAFLAKKPCGNLGRPHWVSPSFVDAMLYDRELLSGFGGSGPIKSASIQRREHFANSLQRLCTIRDADLESAITEIPLDWDISSAEREVWLDRLRKRRSVVFEIVDAECIN